MPLKTYSVEFNIRAIVQVNVRAENQQDAIEKARKEVRGPFKNGLEYVDGSETPVGVRIDDGWNTDAPEAL